MIGPKAAKQHIQCCIRNLLSPAGRMRFSALSGFAGQFPDKPGVYAVFERKRLIYVGESRSLNARMTDLKDTRHHTLRRKLGARWFGRLPGYMPATSKRKFPPSIETRLSARMGNRLLIKAIIVTLGRKEIEEMLTKQRAPEFNSKSRRGEAQDGTA